MAWLHWQRIWRQSRWRYLVSLSTARATYAHVIQPAEGTLPATSSTHLAGTSGSNPRATTASAPSSRQEAR